jgi:hypothetical protein
MENKTTNNPKCLSEKEQDKDNQVSREHLDKALDKDLESHSNNFPIDIFPLPIQVLIHDAKESVRFNSDYLSAGILSTCATAIGNSITLFNGSYSSKPILWISIIGRSGIGKTHPLEFAKNPIETRDKQSYEEYIKLVNEYENNETTVNKPKYSKNILKDFTPEKLAENLQFNLKGTLIFKDELIGWINSFDQYKKGGDQQLYLELFNGGTLTVDRKTSEPIRVEKTNVNIIGGMQPSLIKKMAGNNRSEDGFLSRFLFVYPNNLKPNLFTGNSIKESNVKNYENLISNLFDLEDKVLQVDNSGIEIYKEWQHSKSSEAFQDDLETIIQAKLETYVWRLALIIEMIQQATESNYSNTISNQSLNKAIKLIEYFRFNALKVYNKMLINNPLEGLEKNKYELYQELPNEFNRKDVLPLFITHKIKGGSIGRFLSSEVFTQPKYGMYKKKY